MAHARSNMEVTQHARERAISRLLPHRPFANLSDANEGEIADELLIEMCRTANHTIPTEDKGTHYICGKWVIAVDEYNNRIITIYSTCLP